MFEYVIYVPRDTSQGLMKLTETPSILVFFFFEKGILVLLLG